MNVRLENNVNSVKVNPGPELNKDGFPIYACLSCNTKTGTYNMVVMKDNKYCINDIVYNSLKEAMESIPEMAKDNITFWKRNDNNSVR